MTKNGISTSEIPDGTEFYTASLNFTTFYFTGKYAVSLLIVNLVKTVVSGTGYINFLSSSFCNISQPWHTS